MVQAIEAQAAPDVGGGLEACRRRAVQDKPLSSSGTSWLQSRHPKCARGEKNTSILYI